METEQRLAAEIRAILADLAAKMQEAANLDMRVNFNVAPVDGVFAATSDIVKVIA